MHSLPRSATAPRLDEHQVTLTPAGELGSSQVGDDAFVTDLDISRLELAAHSTEFVEFVNLRIGGGSIADSDWYRMSWVDCELVGVDAANAAFTESTMKRVAWQQSRLVGIQLSGCTLQDAAHRSCVMGMTNLRFANLTRVEFVGCDLSSADLTNARLNQVTFTDCTLDGAQFHDAQCDGVLISGGSLAGVRGIHGLRGASIRADNVLDLAHEMADALGIKLVDD